MRQKDFRLDRCRYQNSSYPVVVDSRKNKHLTPLSQEKGSGSVYELVDAANNAQNEEAVPADERDGLLLNSLRKSD